MAPAVTQASVTTFLSAHARAWSRGDRAAAAVGPAGMPAVRAASSATVRDASAWPTRKSNSSLASGPCTNAALSSSITCSRSACEARMRPRPSAAAAIPDTSYKDDARKA